MHRKALLSLCQKDTEKMLLVATCINGIKDQHQRVTAKSRFLFVCRHRNFLLRFLIVISTIQLIECVELDAELSQSLNKVSGKSSCTSR